MVGIIRTNYIVICDANAPYEVVESIASQLEFSIIQEEKLKELGLSIDPFTEPEF